MEESVLENIKKPQDIALLDEDELERLTFETRKLIIETTKVTGGHLASSLGAVEITVALLRVYDLPHDKIIWDVGHQAYAYKILTDRQSKFHTLRQWGGISGFPKRSESEYDIVDSGHAGSSLGDAFGLAIARDFMGEKFNIAAVIGDGSMTSGVSYEALNQIGHYINSNLVIILNDNGMSISQNVGSISSYLSRIRIKPAYTHMKQHLEEFFMTLPRVGEATLKLMTQIKESLTRAVLRGLFFESLGLKYVGPIDGHNIFEMEETIREAIQIDAPVLIHVVTQKGKGFKPSERKPEKYHGVSSTRKSDKSKERAEEEKTYTELFREAIVEVAKEDRRIFAITAAMTLGTGLDEFSKLFPDRFYDVGIAEQLAVNLGAGLALGGLKPVVAIYSTFLQRAFDQLSQEVCLQNLPVLFVVDRAGLVGEDGETHHGYFDLSYLRMLPNMTVMAPGCGWELKAMILYALSLNSPAAIRFPRAKPLVVDEAGRTGIESGKGEVIREGKDISIFSIGDMLGSALSVADKLKESGISATVVNARFVKPIDSEFVAEVAKKKKLIATLEQNVCSGGFGSAICEQLAKENLNIPVMIRGLPDSYIEHGTQGELLDSVGLSPDAIFRDILRFFKEND
ncbi:MAG: 1-deoxy-D-xylulose-5-phosphate synthase [Actinomycetota bacterium]|nr:1-deoxy-D-xylulose-5-phosphate synthase [Actinomycetota bacterium]